MKRASSALHRITVFAVSAVFALSAVVGIYHCLSRPPDLDSGNTTQASNNISEQLSQGDIALSQRKENYYTILLGGLDNENGGSDTNLLVSVDTKNASVHVLSLPRDTLLNVSWSVKKLNSAYHHGGFERTRTEVSNLLGIPIDFYVTVNLHAFVELIDAIGGVDFDIPVDMDYDDPYQNLHIHFPAGPRHLTGEEALQVVRWRQNNDGTGYATADIGRIGTQQAFLLAAAKQTLQLSNLDQFPTFASIFHENVNTNLKSSNLLWLGEQLLSFGTDAIQFHTLPGDGAGWYNGGSYYIVDDAAALEMINTFFNPYTYDLTLNDMDILVP
ncbi:MAG: LCP family protein [Oscillospiraceae bacterium]|nr:LCP family protein [Oscillospiraceae bacterium]